MDYKCEGESPKERESMREFERVSLFLSLVASVCEDEPEDCEGENALL